MGGAPNVPDQLASDAETPSGVFPAYVVPAGTWPGEHPGGLSAMYSGDVLGDQ